ncbi:MAG: DUF4209 domain-containing protein [Clostridiaceae bacterium]|nr:DUF4209 domain-containing protein [Clostridiaceae bacterium]
MDIYELLNKVTKNDNYESPWQLLSRVKRDNLNKSDVPLFELVKNVSSMERIVSNSSVEFCPMIVTSVNRTFAVEDITENDYKVLMSADIEKLPLIIKALVADILWTQKREFSYSQIAAKAYWQMFKMWYKGENKLEVLDMLRRAVCVSTQTRQTGQTSLYSEICAWIDDFLSSNEEENDGFFALDIMEIFTEQKKCDVSRFLPVLDKIILKNRGNIEIAEQAYKLKTQCLYKLKREKEARANNISLADCYISCSEKILQQEIHGAVRAEDYYLKAIKLYRDNGEPKKAEFACRRLIEIQKEKAENLCSFPVYFNIEGLIDYIKTNMEGLTFEESIIMLSWTVRFEEYDSIKKRVIKDCKKHIFTSMAKMTLIKENGQIIKKLPVLDIQQPEQDKEALELHMHHYMLEQQQSLGDVSIGRMLSFIRERFEIDSSKLEFLVKGNPIIPKGRERIFQNGISMFLKGEYYEAMHILAPQLENLFRNIAKEAGALTERLEDDGSSTEKVLKSIFSLPELLDCYNNDILFMFRGLLNEQVGANIRNKIAHGIIEESECSSGACLYFGVAVIKLLLLTSLQGHKILDESEKLKHFEPTSKDGPLIYRIYSDDVKAT